MERVAILYPRERKVGQEALSIYLLEELLYELGVTSRIFFLDDAMIDLNKFDAVFVSCHYENNYPLLLKMMKNGKLSIFRTERNVPVVMGGPITTNPYPLYEFVDAFVIGDGDNIIHKLKSCLEEGRWEESWVFLPEIKEQAERNFSDYIYNPARLLSKKFLLEMGRGCNYSCLFCLIGWSRKSVVHATLEDVKLMASKTNNFKGYDGVMLVGSDIFSNPEIYEIVEYLVNKKVKISIPSIRLELIEKFEDLLKLAKIDRVTIAPESSERLRKAIGKQVTNEDIYNVADVLKRIGISRVKLYFMIGLPFEKYDDVIECISIVEKIRKSFNGNVGSTFSIFVPKPHTPLQYAPLQSLDVLERKNMTIRKFLKNRAHLTNPKKARIQAWLSIGGRDIGKLLALTYERGLNYSVWIKNAKALEIDLDKYSAEKNPDYKFEFENIDTRMNSGLLYKAYENYKKSCMNY